jgi:hypothetical protein
VTDDGTVYRFREVPIYYFSYYYYYFFSVISVTKKIRILIMVEKNQRHNKCHFYVSFSVGSMRHSVWGGPKGGSLSPAPTFLGGYAERSRLAPDGTGKGGGTEWGGA